ncbi:PREDICTED: uncharacterized protein LOC109581528 [Amphimedon queenslandica]|uniref:Right handed beta helix domain-containing protein n=1 Tax=Amphimedon queenslandica TaxID=400682 RepID=A0A1X7UZW1_AMPQE|nr:PREDICTED: uncharacterized protein LOC109581528 [Amphimedon queenslandica]|eukprot:XP_019851272.1 PREDICTED: uncharacterized protein LOC109581528 [Amphimedon queenslandica]
MSIEGERLLFLLVATLNVFGSLALNREIYISSKEECNQRYGGNCLTSLNEALQEGTESIDRALSITFLGTVEHDELQSGDETVLTDLDYFELVGETSIVTIKCSPEAGLTFRSIGEVVLKNILFLNCGINQVSSSKYQHNNSFINFTVAVYMLNCSRINLEHVHINSSKGTGLTIYDPQESVVITDSVFVNNSQKGQTGPGGGGLQIEFTFCSPGISTCTNDYDKPALSGVTIVINNTNFTDNNATQSNDGLEELFYKAHNGRKQDFTFGHGGGLSIIFKGITDKISVKISGVKISGNAGTFGSGFYVAIHDKAHSNTLTFKDVTLQRNINSQLLKSTSSESSHIDGSGGGGKIILSGENLTENKILISSSLFDSNGGIAGGGLSLELNLNEGKKNSGSNNTVSILSTNFTNNTAFLGAAAYFSQEVLSHCTEFCVIVFLQKLLVNSNRIYCNLTKSLPFSSLPCSGVLYSSGVSLALKSWNNFTSNVGSAIELHTTYADIKSKTFVTFFNNSAVNGGAMALYDCSYIIIGERTKFNFTDNSANVLGGAIFADVCTSNNQPTTLSSKCFLQYYDSYYHPNNWSSTFNFEGNTIGMPRSYSNSSSLYAANAISCWFPPENSNNNTSLNTTFCWQHWHYKPGKCHNHVDSAAAFVKVNKIMVPAIPGGETELPITVWDGTGGIAQPGLIVCVLSGPAQFSSKQQCKSTLNGENSVIFYSKGDESYHPNDEDTVQLSITTKGRMALQVHMSINIEKCTWPLYLSNHSNQCVLIEDYYCCSGRNSCSCTTDCEFKKLTQGKVLIKEKYGLCISRSADNETHAGHCPLSYYDFSCKAYSNISALRNGHCASNREGILCGQCKKGYSIPINSIYLECKNCSHSKAWGWSMFFLLQILPETLMIFLIVIFNLKITNGSISGYILYSQIISINFPAWNYPAWLANLWLHSSDTSKYNRIFSYAAFPFSIWNLDFFTLTQDVEMCIGSKMGAIEVIALQYIVVFYALALFLLLYVWIVMYHKGYGFVVRITRPIHQQAARLWLRMRIKPSLIDSLALIYILCFTQLTSISFKLLHYSTDKDVINNKVKKVYFYDGSLKYFNSSHAIYGSLAIVVLFLFVALPTFLLVVYQFRQTQRVLNCLRLRRESLVALVDVLTGPFRYSTKKLSDFRYFAGLFLLFRIALLSTYFISYKGKNIIPIVQLFLTGITAGAVMIIRPYTENIHNLTNFLLLLVLAGLIALTFVPIDIAVYVIIPVMYGPLLFAIAYCLVWFCKKSLLLFLPNKMNIINDSGSRSMSKKIKSFFESSNRSSRSLPDRMIHPEDYDERHVEVHDNDDNHSASLSSDDEGEDEQLLLVASTYGSNVYGSNANSQRTENIN